MGMITKSGRMPFCSDEVLIILKYSLKRLFSQHGKCQSKQEIPRSPTTVTPQAEIDVIHEHQRFFPPKP